MQQLAITVGIFVALLSDFAIAEIAGGAGEDFALGEEAWRWMLWAGVIPAVAYGFGTYLTGLGLAYCIYAGAAVLAVLFVLKAVPETRGKTLEEM